MEIERLRMASVIGLLIIALLAVSGCETTIESPSNLTKTSDDPCTIEWTDNSDNEDGFKIYLFHSCSGPPDPTEPVRVLTVTSNVTSYQWPDSCVEVQDCIYVFVRAFNQDVESLPSEMIVLSGVR